MNKDLNSGCHTESTHQCSGKCCCDGSHSCHSNCCCCHGDGKSAVNNQWASPASVKSSVCDNYTGKKKEKTATNNQWT